MLAESTGILLDSTCRVTFQSGGSMMHVGSDRSLPTGSLAVGAVYFATGVTATMRDLELVNVLSVFSLAKSWKIPTYFGGLEWAYWA